LEYAQENVQTAGTASEKKYEQEHEHEHEDEDEAMSKRQRVEWLALTDILELEALGS
jgi:hypothetical protein